MTDEELKVIKETIEKTVNGKIDHLRDEVVAMRSELNTHNAVHEEDMKRVLPIVEKYETAQDIVENTTKTGAFMLKVFTIIGTIGAAWIALKEVFPWL